MVVTRRARLLIVLGLDLALIAALVAVGIAGHSIGLLAAGGDYLAASRASRWHCWRSGFRIDPRARADRRVARVQPHLRRW